MKAVYVYSVVLFILMPGLNQAQIIQTNQYTVWGVNDSQIVIPDGSIITEAILTITVVAPENALFYVHLLDNVKAGYETGTDSRGGDFFGQHGIRLEGVYENGNYVCRFSQNNDVQSPIRVLFPGPTIIELGDKSSVSLSSSLLTLMDYAGNGKGFGVGIDPGNTLNLNITGLKLELTVQSYLSAGSSIRVQSYDLAPSAGDINQDLRIDMQDISVFSRNWLAEQCKLPDYCDGCDINKSGAVNQADLFVLIQNWLN